MEYSNAKGQIQKDCEENLDLIDPNETTASAVNQQSHEARSTISTLLEFASLTPPRDACTRVPRPTNAFMIYANQNRKAMAVQFPLDSNKEISKRLGHCWKDLNPERKAAYYTLAKQVDADHKKKYPNYVYNPKEARIRKALRDATREKILSATAGMAPQNDHHQRQRRPAQPWMLPDHDDHIMMSPSEPGGMGGDALRAGMASPMCGMGFPIGMGSITSSYPSTVHHPHAAYMNNPLAQLQHQTELWNPYHHKSQTKSPQDPAYLMSHHPHHLQSPLQSPYAHIPPISFSSSPSTTSHHTNDTNKESTHDDDPLAITTSPNALTKDDCHNEQTHHLSGPTKIEQPDTPPATEEVMLNMRDQQQQVQLSSMNGKFNEYDAVASNADGHADLMKVASAASLSTLITREGYQQQEKIVLQNPFDVQHSSSSSMGGCHMMTPFNHLQHQQPQRKKNYPLIPPSPMYINTTATATAPLTIISEMELRKHFILKYAQNYNYDHMELMLQQPIGSAVSGRPISYHYVTLPATDAIATDAYYVAPAGSTLVPTCSSSQSCQNNIGLNGTDQVKSTLIKQPGQALNLSADLK